MWSISKLVVTAALAFMAPADTPADTPAKREESVIYWSPRTKLIGADFKLPPESDSHFSAGSHLGTGMEISGDGERLTFTVQAYFVPEKSWIKVQNADLLAHEQAHFDLEEYYARLSRRELSRLQVKGRTFDAIRKDADAILTRMLTDRTQAQERFDEETGHSVNVIKEQAWEAHIRQMLEESKMYAGTELNFEM